MARPRRYHSLRSKPPVALAVVTTFASAAALTVLYNHANNPQLTYAQIEQQTGQELARIGYDWARVSIEDGIATISGEAPGESERIIAYDVVRRTLRPLMGRSRVIEGVSSRLKLSAEAIAALAQANSGRRHSGHYLSADSNLPYPPPVMVTAAIDTDVSTSAEGPATAALEPNSAQVHAMTASEETKGEPAVAESDPLTPAGAGDVSTASDSTASESTASATSGQTASKGTDSGETRSGATGSGATDEPPMRTVSIESDAAAASEGPADAPANSDEPASDTSSDAPASDPPAREVAALAEIAPPAPSPAAPSPAGSAPVATSPVMDTASGAARPTAPVTLSDAQLPAPLAATPVAAPIETSAVDTPAKRDQKAEVTPDAAAGPDATTDCKAEFAEALSRSTIEFASNSAVIEKTSRPLLDTLAQIAKRCSRFRLVVEGHTDLSGSNSHNQPLSQRRADAVRWALVDRGVDMDHISAQGFGSSRPLMQGTTEAANARNRRIEFSVLAPQPHGRNASAAR